MGFRPMAGVAVVLGVSVASAAGLPERPNIILCMADDQGYGDVGYSGNPVPHTPTLDAMAASGLRLDRFLAAAPVCSPTRGSVMTGRHPNRFGCFQWGYELRPEEVTIAEVLRDAGYATGHFGKWHLGSVRQGGSNNPGDSGFETWLSAPNFYDNNPILSREGTAVPLEGESSMVAMNAAIDFIDRSLEQDRPFLAVVWFGSPHNPHEATEETMEPYEDLPPGLRHYYGEITGIDRAMGTLRTALRDRGIAGNTLVWYTSDNGPQGGRNGLGSAGGLRGRKGTVYQGGLQVPTIIEWPEAIPEPRSSDLICGSVDILPTVLELAGVAYPQPGRPLDGISLVPLIEGTMAARPKPMGFWDYPAPGRSTPSAAIMAAHFEAQEAGQPLPPELPPEPTGPEERLIAAFEAGEELPGHSAWIDGRHKLHRIPGEAGRIAFELYDLDADPAESTDLSTVEPGRVAELAGALAAWQASVVRSLRGDDNRTRDGR
ncbi:sulfatase-like hydrolase/transferase [Tautonia sociabilis]|uniref:N-acetylgalactosamine 6-sulfate sulfatase n=1 Tax=Tautonia sociabilis TaxID=2080755 RepID=A0A432MCR2_9BACT|nr:sulfatase-like hydrolase/transferase [Tautonia sociabilis]RUL82182.1 N-acetylgalactosamine 6-sulfate sulfatase [Tautonia sociabilis]